MEIKYNQISKIRLISQKITASEFKTAPEIVSWMGAMQAQDYVMAKWAIGVRLAGTTDKQVESAINNGEILRIHVLRPTWHFVAADDIYWMLQLSAPKIKSSLTTRHKQLELTESVISKTNFIIEKALLKELYLTRDELAEEFHKAGIRTDDNRLSHILFRSELDGITCSGPVKENKLTYALLHVRVPHKKEYSRDESLAELAKRYFSSRCPATLEDFLWWSNLTVKDARKAVDLIKSDFFSETMGSIKYLVPNSFPETSLEKISVHFLPAYDEFLISYRNRSNSLSEVNNKRTVSDNGIFYPTVIINGQVTGLWKRVFKKNKVIINLNLFQQADTSVIKLIEDKADRFGKFLFKEAELIYRTL
ncbi:MAG TPA: winged helix DNA-binding domain-containing protein [Bacteroidales bacterium]